MGNSVSSSSPLESNKVTVKSTSGDIEKLKEEIEEIQLKHKIEVEEETDESLHQKLEEMIKKVPRIEKYTNSSDSFFCQGSLAMSGR